VRLCFGSELISGRSYLEDDFSVQCWVGWHPRFVGLASVCGIVYLIGVPLGLALILRTNRHRLTEPRFISTFGFVYRGYHTDRGIVVGWESFVMLRKLAVTAITVSSSDPYIQIFVALLLLIVSYGMQERFLPFETQLLNNIEGLGLFSLIFTQIVSILYLYIDTRTAETGEKDYVLEVIVTLILMVANIAIAVSMVGSYAYAWVLHVRNKSEEYHTFKEERDEPYGALTTIKNPRRTPKPRLRLYTTLTDQIVYTKPMRSSESTGEIAEAGDQVLVRGDAVQECVLRQVPPLPLHSSLLFPYNIRRPPFVCTIHRYVALCCTKGRMVLWFKRADGTGWMMDRDIKTGDPVLELTDLIPDDGTVRQMFWRFIIIADAPIPIRAGTSSAPFIWMTGESVAPGQSLLIDGRFTRTYGCTCHPRCFRQVTFLHLADGRGWFVEPSRVPDTDWIDEDGFVDASVHARLVSQEEHVGTLNSVAVSEYEALEELTIYAKDTWPLGGNVFADGNFSVGTVAANDRFLVASRRTVFTRMRRLHLSIDRCWSKTISWPRSFKVCRRVGRFATFLKLADGRGYVLTNTRKTGAAQTRFHNLRLDSVDESTGRSMLRWNYFVCESAAPITVEPTLAAAVSSYGTTILNQMKRRISGSDVKATTELAQQRFFRPIEPGTKLTICAKFETRLRKEGKGISSQHLTVGKLSGSGGWIVLSPNASLKEIGVYIADKTNAKDSEAPTHAVTNDALSASSDLRATAAPTSFVPAFIVGTEASATVPLSSGQRREDRIAARAKEKALRAQRASGSASEDDFSSAGRRSSLRSSLRAMQENDGEASPTAAGTPVAPIRRSSLGSEGMSGSEANDLHRERRRLSADRRASSALTMGKYSRAAAKARYKAAREARKARRKSAETEMVALGPDSVDHAVYPAVYPAHAVSPSVDDGATVRTGLIWDADSHTPATTPRTIEIALDSDDDY